MLDENYDQDGNIAISMQSWKRRLNGQTGSSCTMLDETVGSFNHGLKFPDLIQLWMYAQ